MNTTLKVASLILVLIGIIRLSMTIKEIIEGDKLTAEDGMNLLGSVSGALLGITNFSR